MAVKLLRADPERYGALAFAEGERVKRLLRGDERLELRLPPPTSRERRRGRQVEGARGTAPAFLEPGDSELLTQLKAWRKQQASNQGVPPYVVFHDRTLVEVAQRRPGCLEELGQIGGVGQVKLDRYGLSLLESLGKWQTPHHPGAA